VREIVVGLPKLMVVEEHEPDPDHAGHRDSAFLLPQSTLCSLSKEQTMQRTPLVLCTAAFALTLAAGSAVAQEATPDTWMQTNGTKTKEQVSAELKQARKDGTIRFGGAGYMEPMPVSRTRLQVRAEVIAARNSGELQEINSEAYAFGLGAPRQAATAIAEKR
jgi:hypothetical protein